MSRTLLLSAAILVSFLGIADSWYLTQAAIEDTALSCSIGAGLDGCNVVAQSPYSKFMGVPLAAYGMLFYSLMFVAAAALLVMRSRMLLRTLFWLSVVGALLSVIFVLIQLFLIKALCVYCILSAVFAFLLLGIALLLKRPVS